MDVLGKAGTSRSRRRACWWNTSLRKIPPGAMRELTEIPDEIPESY
jgi:hypothetical protein